MKFAVFNTLLLALSALRATASPSPVTHNDEPSKKRHENELVIRSAHDTEAAVFIPGPWTVLGLTLVGTFVVTIGANLASNAIQKWIDSSPNTHEGTTAYAIGDSVEEDFSTMMGKMALEMTKHLPEYNVLVVESDAISQISPDRFYWLPIQLENSSGKLKCDLFVARDGFVMVPSRRPNGALNLFEASPGTRVTVEGAGTSSEQYQIVF